MAIISKNWMGVDKMVNGFMRLLFVLFTVPALHLSADFSSQESLKKYEGAFDVFVSPLYWYTSETVDWGHVLTADGNFVEDNYQTISFDWAPGFRIGMGYQYRYFDTQLVYTRFHSQATNEADGPITSGFLAARLSLLEPFGNGEIKGNLYYNMVDADIGSRFSVGRCLLLRPYLGVKAGWINQKLDATWSTPNFIIPGFLFTATEKVKNDFRGGGPKCGLDAQWTLCEAKRQNLRIKAGVGAAFMWGHWVLEDVYTDILLTKTSIPMRPRNFGALMLRALMGFGWSREINNYSQLTLGLSYEIEDWFNHFQVFTNDSGSDSFDLILQGITVDVRLDF